MFAFRLSPITSVPLFVYVHTQFKEEGSVVKILVVDDDRRLLEEVAAILGRNGHTADCVDNAVQAQDMAEKGSYDFVLVDYRMPEHDGIWFMKSVKLPRGTRALLVTSLVDKDVIRAMFSGGVCGYIIKPFDEEELMRNLNFHSERRSGKSA